MIFAMVPLLHDAVVQLVGLHLCWLVFAARQQTSPQKWQSNRHCLEAVAVGFWKLMTVGVLVFRRWWHLEAGGGRNATITWLG